MENSVTKDMAIGKVLSIHRGTARILMEFGMHCLGCPHATAESIQDACRAHGSDADKLIEKLNAYLADK